MTRCVPANKRFQRKRAYDVESARKADDDLEGVVSFIKKHAKHGVVAEIVAAKKDAG